MFRRRLTLVIAISFGFVLMMGGTMFWETNQVAGYFQRSQRAYEAFDHYQRLSLEAYRHFKERLDRLITESPAAQAGVDASKQHLYDAVSALRATAVQPSAEDRADWSGKAAELERVAHFTAFLDASKYRFDEVERLRQQGKREKATQLLSKFSEEEIDGKFQPLIDVAINAERAKADKAREELEALVKRSRWLAIGSALLAAAFSLTSGLYLMRGLRKPLEALMAGTNEIASGNLRYRLALDSGDEFAYLAKHFNQMAQELERQQEKLRKGRTVLERRVAERTQELRQLNEELQRLDNARREFFADISHELRTPITVIRGEAEVTLRGRERDPEEHQDALHRIVELSEQLGKYVNDLLFMARAETTMMQFEWDGLDFAELIGGAIEDFKVMAEENALSVSLHLPDQPVWVRGDKQRLRQVLFILGDNACRYSNPDGHIAAVLSIENGEAVFSLSDEGIGIPAGDLERIFDRHFRSENALHSRDDGTGLGLPMAKSILKAHGGRISVSSTENAGSTFTIALPLSKQLPTG